MNSACGTRGTSSVLVVLWVASFAYLSAGCVGTAALPSGSGGTTGTGGSASGGAPGTGGSASGGAPGTGGSASGGAVATGGSTSGGNASGGSASGGSAGSDAGGNPGTAGTRGSGGAPGTGGSPGGMCNAAISTATSWDQIKASHTIPAWLKQARLGIQIHWGLYAVPAYHNEWFFQHQYCNTSFADWTGQHFPKTSPMSGGPWGYKDFIPMFTAARWNPADWAAVFKKSGAAWVQLSAQHHDRFVLWDSAFTKWDAKDMGPKRDLVGELAAAVRAQGMKFGVSNHIMYGDSFAYCGPSGTTPGNVGPNTPATVSDLYDPKYADFYGPPNSECGALAATSPCSPNQAFCDDWLNRSNELAEKYQLDTEWFDWDGATQGPCAANKLAFVLNYYKKACAWGKEVTTAGKAGVFPGDDTTAAGANIMIHDFETGGHAPKKGEEPKAFWMVDDKIGSESWGYIDGLSYRSSASIISQIDDYHSRGGVLVLNVSPMADGTLPQAQQDILIAIGKHLGAN